ncbi:cation transporter [Caldinitratiruptor microaerophilus]|uniref:Copper chaperone CopZ n=1 Tax=Caldinitratiruptor microaerophilus TaxID=671077 RepID=A0AA35CP85_9FIRM|nr:cation transporter [Caldinitratiruptor microaerophilus]BDG61392.1 copper chaperone CopZ [Caldinitratiruptor microaerophilus]
MASVTLTIRGMTCQHCVMAVKRALKSVAGVDGATVEIGKAVVSYDPAKAGIEEMKKAIAEEGYEVVGAQA